MKCPNAAFGKAHGLAVILSCILHVILFYVNPATILIFKNTPSRRFPLRAILNESITDVEAELAPTIQSPGVFCHDILIKNNQYCNINKCPRGFTCCPSPVATSPHFPRFPLKNQYATPVTPHRGIMEGTFKCGTSARGFSENKLHRSLSRQLLAPEFCDAKIITLSLPPSRICIYMYR